MEATTFLGTNAGAKAVADAAIRAAAAIVNFIVSAFLSSECDV